MPPITPAPSLLERLKSLPHAHMLGWFLAGMFPLLLLYGTFLAAPLSFPYDSYLRVSQGSTATDIAEQLKARGMIRSTFVFEAVARVFGDRSIIAGEYYFLRPQGVIAIVGRITSGDFAVEAIKVTVPEGTSVRGITELLKAVPGFDTDAFYELAKDKEGRLFPDTYFILPGEDPALVLKRFEDNFNAQVSQPRVAIALSSFGKPLDQVLVMASLLEREANDSHNRRLIAGILWKRIEMDIPLQVDAVFPYFVGRGGANITKTDLATDSPYNTYKNKGLPPGAITNPGLDAIMDAITPIKTDYLFYLADSTGTTYYSVDYEQHLRNRAKYIGS